jgi:ABC-2 type transport system ATP-binding protein
MEAILKIRELCKSFGKKDVLKNLNLFVPKNSIFGFVGRNGAGKTTTMKIVLGLLKADEGEVFVCGENANYGETKTNRYIGYLPDVPEFYSYMTAREYLNFCGEITGLDKKTIFAKTTELLTLVGLKDEKGKIRTFSRGMKQRLGMAQALINEPNLLICDEPTSALDPIGRKEILDILLAIKGKTTVLFSTHILNDVERVCDQVAFLNQGEIVLQGSLEDVLEQYSSNKYLIEFSNKKEMARFYNFINQEEKKLDIVENKNSLTISFKDSEADGYFLLSSLAKEEILPFKFEKVEPSLENIFDEVVK